MFEKVVYDKNALYEIIDALDKLEKDYAITAIKNTETDKKDRYDYRPKSWSIVEK